MSDINETVFEAPIPLPIQFRLRYKSGYHRACLGYLYYPRPCVPLRWGNISSDTPAFATGGNAIPLGGRRLSGNQGLKPPSQNKQQVPHQSKKNGNGWFWYKENPRNGANKDKAQKKYCSHGYMIKTHFTDIRVLQRSCSLCQMEWGRRSGRQNQGMVDSMIQRPVIGDALGTFLGIEEDFINGKAGLWPRLLVEIDSDIGALEDLEIITEHGKCFQRTEVDKKQIGGRKELDEGLASKGALCRDENVVGSFKRRKLDVALVTNDGVQIEVGAQAGKLSNLMVEGQNQLDIREENNCSIKQQEKASMEMSQAGEDRQDARNLEMENQQENVEKPMIDDSGRFPSQVEQEPSIEEWRNKSWMMLAR
ncbi:hypothetical protein SUGI_0306530 [Cryptomeria japonica]|nr:hypothetical protein SUGI_0306530 [Cryptomeria japonica]